MKEYISTTGFILGNFQNKENSALITALTPDTGIISFTNHGCNSKKNIIKPLLQPINLVGLQLELKAGKYKIIECNLINPFDGIKTDYNKTVTSLSVLGTLTNSDIYDKRDYNLIFTLVKKFLDSINEKQQCLLTAAVYFYFQLAWCLGISFSFKNEKKMKFSYLYIENGLFISDNNVVVNDNLLPVSEKLYEILQKFINMRFADIDKLNYITVNEYNEFRQMYKKYTGYHFNKPIIIQPAMIREG